MPADIPTTPAEHGKPRCVFDICWVGQCKAAGEGDPPMCEKHRAEKCWCGAQAVRQCSVAGSFVCGAPLCADHECIYTGSGMTGTLPHSKQGRGQLAVWKKHQAELAASRIAEHERCVERLVRWMNTTYPDCPDSPRDILRDR